MAIKAWQYSTDGGAKLRVYLDDAKLQNGLTTALLGLVAADGTEVGTAHPSGSGRRRGVTTRRVSFKNIASGNRVHYPAGTVAAYSALVTTSVYVVSSKRGEVNKL